MPVYAFTCADCGPFELTRAMAAAAAPAPCPACGDEARRVYTPPALAQLARPMSRALDIEAKSAHEPEVAAEKSGRARPHSHSPAPPWTLTH